METANAPQVVDTSLFGQIFAGLVSHPTACILTLTLIALAFLYRAREADRVRHEEKVQKLNDDHKETMKQVIPVAEKLSDAAIAVEKLTVSLEHVMDRAERLLEKQ